MLGPEDISKLAFLLYPYIVRAAPEEDTVESLAQRIEQLRAGFSPEDEFAATICWLGNCAGIHRLGQEPMPIPETMEKMRAPDFLAFPIVNGRPFPVLIEVKSSKYTKIKWSEGYRRSLICFAEYLSLPLLVAWKCGPFWLVVDSKEFEKSVTGYRLTLEQGLRQDLSSVLFRNLRIQMNHEMELILDMEICDELEGDANALVPAGTHTMRITHAAFQCGGSEVQDRNSFAFSLLLAAPDESEFRRTGKQTCQQVFRPKESHGFSLSSVLVAQLSISQRQRNVDWHRALAGPLPSSGLKLRRSLREAIDQGFIRYVMDIVPNTWPGFLPDRESVVGNRGE